MRKIPLGNLNSNNPIKTSVKKYHASVARQSPREMCIRDSLGVDGTGSLYGLTFDYQTASPTKTQFYLLDDYYRVMNHLTE